MNEKEIGEIRRRVRRDRSNMTAIYGCYVNSQNEIVSEFKQSTGIMPENEAEKYFGLMKRVLSGSVGKNLLDITFKTAQVSGSAEHKLLTIAAMVMFCEWGMMPGWALMLVLAREFAVTGLRLVAVGKGKVIAAGWSGKVKTASTMIGLCVMMAFPTIGWIGIVVNAVIVVTTIYSGVEYFAQNWNCLWDN